MTPDPREPIRLMNPYRGLCTSVPTTLVSIILVVAILTVLGVAARLVTP